MSGANVIQVDQDAFEAEVLERSKEVPVVVDFWAGWCRPCLVLGPVLERLAGEYEGRFVLAKVDVDRNPTLAQVFGIQGIPAVKAFRDGEVASEFVGVQPEAVIRRFLDELAPDTARLAPARDAEAAGDADAAEAAYRAALETDPGDEEATIGLARLLVGRDELEEARTLLARVPGHAEAAPLQAQVDLHAFAAAEGPAGEAARDILAGRYDEALPRLLALVAGGGEDGDDARQVMIAVFDLLGDDDDRTRTYRPKLASALF